MHTKTVDIYSDETNRAMMRHPDRNFPGILIQGDTLYHMCQRADAAVKMTEFSSPAYEEMNDLRNQLWSYLNHYQEVLIKHKRTLPYSR